MKRAVLSTLVALGLSAITAAPLMAQPAAPAAAPAAAAPAKAPGKSKLMGEYAVMAKELSLTPDQQTKITNLLQDKANGLKTWDNDNGAKVKDAQKAINDAKAAKDKTAVSNATKSYNEITAGRKQVADGFDKQIEDLLTPEQAKTWANFQFYHSTVSAFGKAKLTDAQKADIRTRSDAEYAKVSTITDAKAKAAEVKAFNASIAKDVLTAEQRDEMTAKPAPKAAATPAAAPASK